ncbi:hypothetical protein AB0M34_28230 [Nocardia sp. NPDC050193]
MTVVTCAVIPLSGCAQSVSGSAVAADVTTSASPDLARITGVWVGSYTCAQGETGLKLTVEATGRTVFAFYPLPAHPGAETGSYEMRAAYDGDRVEFEQVRWIDRPKDYGMVDLTATQVKPSTMTGKVEANGCTTFRVELQRG